MELKFIHEDTVVVIPDCDGYLKTAVFCFTGKSPKSRQEMEAIAIKAGASVTKSVNDRTTILVITDVNSTSSKAKKARANSIYMISPSQFFMMCSSVATSNDNDQIKKPKKVTKPSKKEKYSSIRPIQL